MPLTDLKLAALDAASRAVVITDAEGVILWANPAIGAVSGYDPEWLVGQHTRIFRSRRHSDSFYANLWTTLACGQRWSGRVVNRRKDGTLYTEEMVITPLTSADEGVVHYLAVKEDVTEQIEAEEHRKRQAAEIRKLNVELAASLRAGILMVADLADRFSPTRGKHARRVSDLSMLLARQLRLDRIVTDRIRYGALLHDIGKAAEPVTGDTEVHLLHAATGARMLAPIAKLDDLASIVRHHHERWDGTGAPDGLKGQAIPIGARIVAVADAFDNRLYANNESVGEAMRFIRAESGTRFDPSVVDALSRELANPDTTAELDTGILVGIEDLEVGMVLTDGIRTRSGVLVYSAGTRINERCLSRLSGDDNHDPVVDRISVRRSFWNPDRLDDSLAAA